MNDVPKFSWIHHSPSVLSYHQLTQSDIRIFSIELLDSNMIPLSNEILPNWSACVIFEEIEEIEYRKEDILAYKERAYILGHPIINR